MDAIPFLDIPFVSVVFFFGAGILAGHLLWYRDRSDDETTLIGLRGENNELQNALHKHKQAYVDLEAHFDDHRQEWERLKAANQQLEQTHYDAERERADMQAEVTRLQQLKDQAFHDLDQERQQRRALQEALAIAEQNSKNAQSSNDQLQSQVLAAKAELAETHEANQASARQQSAMLNQLALQRDTFAAERDATNSELSECKATLERLRRELQSCEQDLEALRQERDELQEQIEDERTVREQLGGKVAGIDQLVAQRDEAMERCNLTERKLEVVITQRDEAMERLGTSEQEREELRAKLEDRTEITRLEQAHVQLQAAHATLQANLSSLQGDRDTVAATLRDERERLARIETQNQQLSARTDQQQAANELVVGELREIIALRESELINLRAELEEIAAKLAQERHQREHLQGVLDQRRAEADELDREQERLVATIKVLTTQNDKLIEQSNILAALRGEHASVVRMLEDQTVDLRATKTERDALSAGKLAADERIEEFEGSVAGLEASRLEADKVGYILRSRLAEAGELRRALATEHDRIDKLVAQRDELADAKATLEDQVQQLEQQLETQSQTLSTISQQHEHLRQQLQLETERYQQASVSLDEHRANTDQLEDELRHFEELREEYLELKTRLNDMSDRLRHVALERDQQHAAATDLQHRLEQLDRRNQANEDTIRHLRRERGVVLTRLRQPGDRPLEPRSMEDESGGRLRRDEVLGLVYTQPPKRKDDLKKISGIAQVLEKKLNAFGVYTYRQIMEWDAVAIAEFSKLLSFRDRIVRDDWVGQARNLHHDSYGRAA